MMTMGTETMRKDRWRGSDSHSRKKLGLRSSEGELLAHDIPMRYSTTIPAGMGESLTVKVFLPLSLSVLFLKHSLTNLRKNRME